MKKFSCIIFFVLFSFYLFSENKIVEYYSSHKDEIGKIEQSLFDYLKLYAEGNQSNLISLLNELPNFINEKDNSESKVLPLSTKSFINIKHTNDNVILLCYLTDDDYLDAYLHHLYEYNKFCYSFGKPIIEIDKGLINKKNTQIAGIETDWIIKEMRIRYTDNFCCYSNGKIDSIGPIIIVEPKVNSKDLQQLIPLKFECKKRYLIENSKKTIVDIDEPLHKFIIDLNKNVLYTSDFLYVATITKSDNSKIFCEGENESISYTYEIDRELGTYNSHAKMKEGKSEMIDTGIVSLIKESLF